MAVLSAVPGALLLAQSADSGLLIRHLLAAIVFAIVGIVVLALSFWLMERLSPFSLKKEIEEDQNLALGVVMGSVVIGISLIIAASIQG
ncbi:MAG: DUF350 domain-containing protein [Fuerstiella sp.]|nr:DUF350 domain-containing protein [Fuerstiella sp.]